MAAIILDSFAQASVEGRKPRLTALMMKEIMNLTKGSSND